MSGAFLQGDPLHRVVFVRSPRDMCKEDGIVWRLLKGLYGLPDAGQLWYKCIKRELESLGGREVDNDPGIFIWSETIRSAGLLHCMLMISSMPLTLGLNPK